MADVLEVVATLRLQGPLSGRGGLCANQHNGSSWPKAMDSRSRSPHPEHHEAHGALPDYRVPCAERRAEFYPAKWPALNHLRSSTKVIAQNVTISQRFSKSTNVLDF